MKDLDKLKRDLEDKNLDLILNDKLNTNKYLQVHNLHDHVIKFMYKLLLQDYKLISKDNEEIDVDGISYLHLKHLGISPEELMEEISSIFVQTESVN